MNHIRQHWDTQAATGCLWHDTHCIQLEREQLQQNIRHSSYAIEYGCGLGDTFAALRQSGHLRIDSVAIDSSPVAIQHAKNKYPTILFREGDITQIPDVQTPYDVAYTVRCLINLPTWTAQADAIRSLLRIARRVILCEAFWEPLQRLNALRAIMDLDPLIEHDFNRYLKLSRLHNLLYKLKLDNAIKHYDITDFSGTYYLGTRFLRELIGGSQWDYNNPIAAHFANMQHQYPSANGVGIQQCVVITRKD